MTPLASAAEADEVTRTEAAQSLTMYSTSPGARCQLIGVTNSPARIPAQTASKYSVRFSIKMATWSPTPNPRERNALASRLDGTPSLRRRA